MDIVITTVDPDAVSLDDIGDALEEAGFYVAVIAVQNRKGDTIKSARYGEPDEAEAAR